MWKYDSSGSPIKVNNFTPVNLNMGPQFAGCKRFIDLNLSRSVFCDIGHINKDDQHFCLDLLDRYNAQREHECLNSGHYTLQYVVYSANSRRIETYFDIWWSGTWQDDQEKMFREIIIKPTTKPKE